MPHSQAIEEKKF